MDRKYTWIFLILGVTMIFLSAEREFAPRKSETLLAAGGACMILVVVFLNTTSGRALLKDNGFAGMVFMVAAYAAGLGALLFLLFFIKHTWPFLIGGTVIYLLIRHWLYNDEEELERKERNLPPPPPVVYLPSPKPVTPPKPYIENSESKSPLLIISLVIGVLVIVVLLMVANRRNKESDSAEYVESKLTRTKCYLSSGATSNEPLKGVTSNCITGDSVFVDNRTSLPIQIHMTFVEPDGKGSFRWGRWRHTYTWNINGYSRPYLKASNNEPMYAGGYRYYITKMGGRPLIRSKSHPIYGSTCSEPDGIEIVE